MYIQNSCDTICCSHTTPPTCVVGEGRIAWAKK